jgi:integrase
MASPVRLRPEERHSLSVSEAIDEFARYQRVSRSQPELRVRDLYVYPLRSILLPFCADRGITRLDDFDRRTLDELVMSIQEMRHRYTGAPLSAASKQSYLKKVKAFLTWAREEDMTMAEAERIGIPRLKRKAKDLPTGGEQQRLVEAARTVRDQLIIRILLETGVREEGVANLEVSDIVERDRQTFLRLRDKTSDGRWAPISRQLYRDLIAYRKGNLRKPSKSERLFISERRNRRSRSYEPLGVDGIYDAVKLAGELAEIDRRRVKPHWLRAAAITRMCARGMSPVLVSEITGVSVGVISQYYARPSLSQLWEAAERTRD